jgi:thiosulfate dehydrogenase
MRAVVLKYETRKADSPVKFVAGLVLGLILVPVFMFLYFTSGTAPVATTDSDIPFENYLAHKALNARVAKDMPKNVPIPANEANYVAGAELYKSNCGVCHGVPLSPKTGIATGMYPRPPQLFQGKGVTDDEPGETYWKIFNGIRLTGMPGFSKSLSETQMWQVALLLANADKLPDAAKAALVAPVGGNTASGTPPTPTPIPPPPPYPSSMQPPK